MTENDSRDIDSPCINVCAVDRRAGICVGCGRTLTEIAAWSELTPEMRRRLMEVLPDRLAAFKRR